MSPNKSFQLRKPAKADVTMSRRKFMSLVPFIPSASKNLAGCLADQYARKQAEKPEIVEAAFTFDPEWLTKFDGNPYTYAMGDRGAEMYEGEACDLFRDRFMWEQEMVLPGDCMPRNSDINRRGPPSDQAMSRFGVDRYVDYISRRIEADGAKRIEDPRDLDPTTHYPAVMFATDVSPIVEAGRVIALGTAAALAAKKISTPEASRLQRRVKRVLKGLASAAIAVGSVTVVDQIAVHYGRQNRDGTWSHIVPYTREVDRIRNKRHQAVCDLEDADIQQNWRLGINRVDAETWEMLLKYIPLNDPAMLNFHGPMAPKAFFAVPKGGLNVGWDTLELSKKAESARSRSVGVGRSPALRMPG